jgi:ABC-2 type transport system ATP-binding protein
MRLMRRRGRIVTVAAAVAAAMAAGVTAIGLGFELGPLGGDAQGLRVEDHLLEVGSGSKDDQKVTLDATFLRPARAAPAPAILLAHGFGGAKDDTRAEAEQLARAGYAVLTWSARGFGRSTGEIALNSPDKEIEDVRRLIDWLARRPEVLLDRPGDPRVGITGGSYGGAVALLTAGYDDRVDAIAPRVTWHDLADVFFPNATGEGPERGVFKKLWASIFFSSGVDDGRPGGCGRLLPSLCADYQRVAQTGRPDADAIATLRRSSPAAVAGRITAPTLLVQGQSDSLFLLDQADANARAITRAPVSVVWVQGGHGGDPETSRVRTLVRRWFDRWLRRDPGAAGVPGFMVTRPGGVDSASQRLVLQAASIGRYPGLSGAPPGSAGRTLPLSRGPRTVHNPAGGSPASISAVPGLGIPNGIGGFAGALIGGLPTDMPGQAAAFDSGPLDEPLRVTGAASARVRVAGDPADPHGDVVLFAKLYDVGPDGRAVPARSLAAPLRVPDAGPGRTVTVTLPAMDYQFARGHRLRLVLATTDLGFATPARPATYTIAAVSGLAVPTVPALTVGQPWPPAWVWILPAVALALAAAITAHGRRRRAGESGRAFDPELADVPVQITGLTKTYRNGQLAVDDLSLRIGRGQVLGLLGPNGAGKTTTLRMLMGLVHPDAGTTHIFGHRVTPGAAVLARLGSFVEGPGFLPHLSGRDNLDLYWRATGRRASHAHVDEALAIADLGAALDRPVRTYSHGMRQRLAIAQAMLGLPDLLILDEPTNGLDPPQIREMRNVLVGYAALGRTVIISSHLLAEVEQTCTHVVLMSRGRGVAAGPVAEIIGSRQRLEDAFLEIIAEGAS